VRRPPGQEAALSIAHRELSLGRVWAVLTSASCAVDLSAALQRLIDE
jgi:hypothetical protein